MVWRPVEQEERVALEETPAVAGGHPRFLLPLLPLPLLPLLHLHLFPLLPLLPLQV